MLLELSFVAAFAPIFLNIAVLLDQTALSSKLGSYTVNISAEELLLTNGLLYATGMVGPSFQSTLFKEV